MCTTSLLAVAHYLCPLSLHVRICLHVCVCVYSCVLPVADSFLSLQIELPMMLLNTEDDPLVPAELLGPAYKLAGKSQLNVCPVLTAALDKLR